MSILALDSLNQLENYTLEIIQTDLNEDLDPELKQWILEVVKTAADSVEEGERLNFADLTDAAQEVLRSAVMHHQVLSEIDYEDLVKLGLDQIEIRELNQDEDKSAESQEVEEGSLVDIDTEIQNPGSSEVNESVSNITISDNTSKQTEVATITEHAGALQEGETSPDGNEIVDLNVSHIEEEAISAQEGASIEHTNYDNVSLEEFVANLSVYLSSCRFSDEVDMHPLVQRLSSELESDVVAKMSFWERIADYKADTQLSPNKMPSGNKFTTKKLSRENLSGDDNVNASIEELGTEELVTIEPETDEEVTDDLVTIEPNIDEEVADDLVTIEPDIDEEVTDDLVTIEPDIDEEVTDDLVTTEPDTDEPKTINGSGHAYKQRPQPTFKQPDLAKLDLDGVVDQHKRSSKTSSTTNGNQQSDEGTSRPFDTTVWQDYDHLSHKYIQILDELRKSKENSPHKAGSQSILSSYLESRSNNKILTLLQKEEKEARRNLEKKEKEARRSLEKKHSDTIKDLNNQATDLRTEVDGLDRLISDKKRELDSFGTTHKQDEDIDVGFQDFVALFNKQFEREAKSSKKISEDGSDEEKSLHSHDINDESIRYKIPILDRTLSESEIQDFSTKNFSRIFSDSFEGLEFPNDPDLFEKNIDEMIHGYFNGKSNQSARCLDIQLEISDELDLLNSKAVARAKTANDLKNHGDKEEKRKTCERLKLEAENDSKRLNQLNAISQKISNKLNKDGIDTSDLSDKEKENLQNLAMENVKKSSAILERVNKFVDTLRKALEKFKEMATKVKDNMVFMA